MDIFTPIFSTLAVVIASFFGFVSDPTPLVSDTSPELRLAELSPEGESGGYAVPASGCSQQNPLSGHSGHAGYYSNCPTVNAQSSLNSGAWSSASPRGTDFDHNVRIRNSGSLPASGGGTCEVREDDAAGALLGSYSTASFIYDAGTLGPDVNETFYVRCRGNEATATAWRADSVTITVPPESTTELRARIDGQSWEIIGPLVIGPTDQIHMRWNSTDARSCSAVSSLATSNFSTVSPEVGNSLNGTDESITEPDLGTSATYGVNCDGAGGDSDDAIEVQRPALDPVITVQNSDNDDATVVEVGESVTLDWELYGNDPTACTITGPTGAGGGFTFTPTADSGTYPNPLTVVGESDYTITCAPNTPSLIPPIVMVNPGGTMTWTVNIVETSTET